MLKTHRFEFNPLQENTYIIYNEFNECAIIDPGCYFDEEKDALVGFIHNNNLTPLLLLNTHCHLDHVFGNKFVAEKYGLTLHIHAGEKSMLDLAPVSGLRYNLPFENYSGEIITLNDNQEIVLGKDKLKVLLAPGHSPASVCYYSNDANFVISGDVLFRRSIGRTDLPGGDLETLLRSIREKLFCLPGGTNVLPGHGDATTVQDEMKYNPFLVAA